MFWFQISRDWNWSWSLKNSRSGSWLAVGSFFWKSKPTDPHCSSHFGTVFYFWKTFSPFYSATVMDGDANVVFRLADSLNLALPTLRASGNSCWEASFSTDFHGFNASGINISLTWLKCPNLRAGMRGILGAEETRKPININLLTPDRKKRNIRRTFELPSVAQVGSSGTQEASLGRKNGNF